jgi:hypothetical protein
LLSRACTNLSNFLDHLDVGHRESSGALTIQKEMKMVSEQVCFSPDFDREANEWLAEINL